MLPIHLASGLRWSPVDLAHPVDMPGPPACFLCFSRYCLECSLGQPPEASGRLRDVSCSLRQSSGGIGPPSGYQLYPSATLRRLRASLGVPPVPFGDPPEASAALGVPPVPFGDSPEASGACGVPFGEISCLSSVSLARLVGPVGYPYDKPLAVDVLLRHG